MVDFTVNPNSAVYYSGIYWNDYEAVQREIARRVSGNPTLGPAEQFAKTTGRTFDRALILNCGNGWFERDMHARGLVREVVGVEYSETLLEEARSCAAQEGVPAVYYQMDINTADFPFEGIDLVVNHAAAHHIAYLDRVFRELCRLLPADGWFFAYDYVGAHRNQYACEAWEAAWRTNLRLPEHLRHDLVYPHLPSLLSMDPTEAIHSELILDMFRRYFLEQEFVPVGGAIAYPLLTHNHHMWNASEDERSEWVALIMQADAEFLETNPESTLFAYFTGRPNKRVLDDVGQLEEWTVEEHQREAAARVTGGEYYPRSALTSISIAAAESSIFVEHRGATIEEMRHRIMELERELDSVRSGASYRLATHLSRNPVARGYLWAHSKWTRRRQG